MSKRITKYPVLPHIAYGLLEDGGFYISLPFKGISLNEYRKFHSGKIKNLRGQYKSILDLIVVTCFKKTYIKIFGEDGIKISTPLFKDKVTVDWILTWQNSNKHDPSNYTQKILLDAIVDVGIIQDDNEDFVINDNVVFGEIWYDSITCVLKGSIKEQMIKKSTKKISSNKLLEAVESL